ncbi:ABC transporter ATP-binding protein [Paenibacillus methanolicus]|uniref:ABC-2 type transport system ATP-binding protein n=1 Tax=Paenibacillus methanolicus TaxID=582686 RepID=A0A5S5C824_9BACL|nr:ABC transporter ATP-binding protein [Paenibacillus methanolicus]TYP75457.1 ABC-2 type transport system ATP-binding protein [Paenibacillus methanolicus]
MNAIAKVTRLSKVYSGTAAVAGVSFTLEANKIYGLLGRNGAGKTTIMHMLTAQSFPTSGEIAVFGEAPYENDKVLSRICFIKESQKYPDHYRVCDVLRASALFFPNWDADFAERLLADFRLPLKRKVKKLSRGMLSSVGIIVGLASRAPLTIFDEPYLGLDAVARSLFYDRLLEDYAEHPRTVVLSTHLIDEVSQMLEHVLVIDQGRLLLDEDTEDLRGKAFAVSGAAVKLEAFLSGRQALDRQSLGSIGTAVVWSERGAEDRRAAEAAGLELAPVSLQQLVVYLTNGKLQQKAGDAR